MATESETPELEYDLNAIGAAIAEAPDAGFVNANYGRVTVLPQIVSWSKQKDPQTGKSKKIVRPMTKGDAPKNGESLELLIAVDIAEFNPALEFRYERNIAIRKSTPKDKSDWTEIVEPSLIAVFGKDWLSKVVARPYVQIEDVANVNGITSKKSPNKVLTVPKFVAAYASMIECKAARDARYSSGSESDAEAALNAAVDQVRGLITALDGDLDGVRALLSNPPFNAFDSEQLITLAQV